MFLILIGFILIYNSYALDSGARNEIKKPIPDEQEYINKYKAEVILKIQMKWAYIPDPKGKDLGLEALMGVKILSNGKIQGMWFDKRSGNKFFDECAENAVLNSDPLPKFPKEIKDNYMVIGLRFTPQM